MTQKEQSLMYCIITRLHIILIGLAFFILKKKKKNLLGNELRSLINMSLLMSTKEFHSYVGSSWLSYIIMAGST